MQFASDSENGCYILNLDEKTSPELLEGPFADKKCAKLALNFEKVTEMSDELLEFLKNAAKRFKVSIFGANTQILGYLSLLNLCGAISIYQNENDFYEDKRRFVKRAFTLIKWLCLPLLPMTACFCF